MYEGERSRKSVLVEYGFRLPSAMDNRPLQFDEFMRRQSQILYVSATPADFEIRNSFVGNRTYLKHAREATGTIGEGETVPARLAGMHATWAAGQTAAEATALAPAPRPALKLVRKQEPQNPVPGIAPEGSAIVPQLTHSQEQAAADAAFEPTVEGRPLIVEQIIRPTGLLDPQITIKPLKHQIDDTIEACRVRIEAGQRALVTTLTKRTAEDLADYLRDVGLKVRYLHSEIDTIERVEILRGLRAGDFDVLVGINLLREGLDLPEVSLICILDADKEGYLRSQTSLIQTAGRAARHVEGSVILFADTVTQSMRKLIEVTEYRRRRQIEYNTAHGITPQSVRRAVQESLHTILRGRDLEESVVREGGGDFSVTEVLRELEVEMAAAAASLEYEKAALLRDQIMELKRGTGIDKIEPKRRPGKVSYSRGTGGGARGFNGGPAKRPALKFKKSG
jgi:excinuclease ABC subunit B